MISKDTGLTEGQVYKWGWDQKRKQFGIEVAEKMRQDEHKLDQEDATRKQQQMQQLHTVAISHQKSLSSEEDSSSSFRKGEDSYINSQGQIEEQKFLTPNPPKQVNFTVGGHSQSKNNDSTRPQTLVQDRKREVKAKSKHPESPQVVPYQP